MSDSGERSSNKATVEELEKGAAIQVSSTDKHLTRKVLWKLDTRFRPAISFDIISYFSLRQLKNEK